MKQEYRVFVALLAAALCGAPACAQSGAALPALQLELMEMRKLDQDALRDKGMPADRLHEIQRQNQEHLKRIIREHGWPTLTMVGNDAAQGAWLVVQHADHDRPWQREVLGLMEALIDRNEVRKADIAYLRDRLDRAEQRPQRYGTQGRCNDSGSFEPFPLAEPEQVDARRAAMGLSPLEEYKAFATSMMCKKKPS